MCVGVWWVLTGSALAEPRSAWPQAFEADSAKVLSPFTQSIRLGRQMRYTINPALTPDDLTVPREAWQVNTTDTVSFGFQTEPHWFVVDLITEAEVPRYWVLELGNAMIDQVAVFLYQDGRLTQQWQSGDRGPFYERPLESARFQFPVELEGGGQYQIYLRVESTEALELPLTLAEHFTHTVETDRRSLVDGIFHGFLIIMAAYSLAIYAILRDNSYLYYAFYVVSMLLFFLSQQGLLYQYLYPAFPLAQHYVIPWVSMLIFLSIALFFGTFLDFRRQNPRIWLFYKTLLWIHGGLSAAVLVAQYQTVVSLMAANVTLSMALAVVAIVKLSRSGSRPAQIVLAGWGVLFFFITLFVFARTGIFYNDFLASYGLRIGVSLEILIFSFALSFRINQERQEKEWALNNINVERAERIQAQELALSREVEAREARETSLQLEIQHRESLEQEVAERTADLAKTLQELERANAELEQLSTRDALTGLHNRRLFDTRLGELWRHLLRKQQPLSLLLLDVDHFKQVNDNYGHPCGDMVLVSMAELLRSILHRPTDVIARYGGEEIAVLLPETPEEGARHVAEMIVNAAAEKVYEWEGQVLHVTVSIGLHSLTPTAALEPQALVQGADEALYQAKRNGRNQCQVYRPGVAQITSR